MKTKRVTKKVVISEVFAILLALCMSFVGTMTVRAGGTDGVVEDELEIMDTRDKNMVNTDARDLSSAFGINIQAFVLDDSVGSTKNYVEEYIKDYGIDDTYGIVSIVWTAKNSIEVFVDGPATSTYTKDVVKKIEYHYKDVAQEDVSSTMSTLSHEILVISAGKEPEYFSEEVPEEAETVAEVDNSSGPKEAITEEKSNNTIVWIIVGVVVLCAIGGVVIFLTKKKRGKRQD